MIDKNCTDGTDGTDVTQVHLCVVCAEHPKQGLLFCEACAQDYDRVVADEHTIAVVVSWAATRARD